jgi:uncharacterized protein (TIGR00730 family)
MKICVYGAASSAIDEDFKRKVQELGNSIVERGHSLVFGGGANGLMGAVAKGVREKGGHILGVIPQFFMEEDVEIVFKHCDELLKPETMRERKQIMEDNADAFIIVPGGIGTFEEFFEILTLKQLRRHEKPIAIYNLQNYYDELQTMMQSTIKKGFLREECLGLYKVTTDLEELFAYIEGSARVNKTIRELKDG